jgi:STIP1 family protein 1
MIFLNTALTCTCREACENALQEHHFLSGTLPEHSDNEYSEQCKLLSEVFTKAVLDDTPGDVKALFTYDILYPTFFCSMPIFLCVLKLFPL